MAEMVAIQSSKETKHLLAQAKPGDMIEFKRNMYSHWAIYMGDGLVIHRWGVDDGIGNAIGFRGNITTFCGAQFDKATVLQSAIDDVLKLGGTIQVNNYLDKKWKPLPVNVILACARKALNSEGYNLIYGNCEHFATGCRYGQESSRQVQVAVGATALTGVALILAVGLAGYAITKMFPSPVPTNENDDDEKKIRNTPVEFK